MHLLLKYIVFFIFCFNVSVLNAAEPNLETQIELQEDEEMENPMALVLPHAADMRRILDDPSNSSMGKLLILGKYFDEKYPDELISADFSEDVAVIFPELNQQEVYDRTQYIRYAVATYRWGVKKYQSIKESFLAPAAPPLTVDEQDYDLPENYEYISTKDGQFAILYDFKKVLSYGNNPRDLKAMEARKQRLLDSKKSKTSFDKFKSMISKLEFSKIPFYGISLPNPLVGNAGLGAWQEQQGFRVRLAADTAEISNVEEFMAAVHVAVPGHRFILATSLLEDLKKPQIEFYDMQNIQSYEVFYPLPVKVAGENMLGGYAGDFAFPIRIKTINPENPVQFKAKVSFESCDDSLNCQTMTFFPELSLQTGDDNVNSSLQNFIKQSFYNVPQAENKHFSLEKATFSQLKDRNIAQINLTFKFTGHVDGFAVFLEDEILTRFASPRITIDGNRIYVVVGVENNQDKLLFTPITLTARLNAYSRLRQQITLSDSVSSIADEKSLFSLLLGAFLAGFLFSLMPLGFAFWGLLVAKSRNRRKYFAKIIQGVFIGANLSALMFIYLQHKGLLLLWGMQYQSIIYIMMVLFLTMALMIFGTYKLPILQSNAKKIALWAGVLVFLLMPLSYAPFLSQTLVMVQSLTWLKILAVFNALAIGISLFYALLMIKHKTVLNAKKVRNFKKLILLFSLLMLVLTFGFLLLTVFLQLSLLNFLKIIGWLAMGWLVLKYGLLFLQTVYKTKLSKLEKSQSAQVVSFVIVLVLGLCSYGAYRFSKQPSSQIANAPDMVQVEQKISQGKTVMLGIEADWCFVCHYNNLTALNKTTLSSLEKSFDFEYIPINATKYDAKLLEYMQKYGRVSPPLYVMYNINVEDGLVLPDFLTSIQLEQTVRNFDL